jgi:hypothetical protein
MKVLIGCEESQIICMAFRSLGHEAYSCDLKPCSGGHPEWHIQGDILEVMMKPGWDLMIGHPMCTRLCNSGVRWLAERNLWKEMEKACDFFNAMKAAPIPKICLENPIPHGYATERIGAYDQKVQPWQFGDGKVKATCFWLKGLPPLLPTHAEYSFFAERAPDERKAECFIASPGPERSTMRSKTYPGIARAMAKQWSDVTVSKPYDKV